MKNYFKTLIISNNLCFISIIIIDSIDEKTKKTFITIIIPVYLSYKCILILRMNRINSNNVKDNIILAAFILFSSKPYSEVTYSDFEKATGLSRGGIQHHVGNKLQLFKEALKSSLTKRTSIIDIPLENNNCLMNFISRFADNCIAEKKTMKNMGIKNINLAHLNLEQQALYYLSDIETLTKHWLSTEHKLWTNVINRAKEHGEIKNDITSEELATLFQNAYIGRAYQGVMEEKGCDIDILRKELLFIYNLVKK